MTVQNDFESPTMTAQKTLPKPPVFTGQGATGDDVGSGGAKPATAGSPPEANGEFIIAPEVQGDAPGGSESDEASQEEFSGDGESAGGFTEATPEQLAAESGDAESAVSDLRGIEGFEESTATESGAQGSAFGLAEVGEESGQGAEFLPALPFLASLVPTLATSVGPAIAKGIVGKLSPRASKAIKSFPARKAGSLAPGSIGAVLAQIAQLLKTLPQRPGSESEIEAADEAMVDEAVAVLEVIIGTDDRVRIRNTKDEPWKRICALRITFPTGATYRGSGFLIGLRTVVTAGHCVYLHNQGGWARKVEVIPGGQEGTVKPFGSAVSSQFRSVAGWVRDKKPESDYGCIVLPAGSFSGRNLGSFGFGNLSAQELVAKPAVVAGYPGDKPFAELWGMARKIKTVGANTLVYDVDTMGGQSGCPVYIRRGGDRIVVGIHNYGAAGGNSATRVTQAVAQRLLVWSKL